jgi:hypothetical protein
MVGVHRIQPCQHPSIPVLESDSPSPVGVGVHRGIKKHDLKIMKNLQFIVKDPNLAPFDDEDVFPLE